MRRFSTAVAVAFSTLFLVAIGTAQQTTTTTVPNLIRYGGVLKDAQGAAISSRTVGITFLIYGQQDGGAPVWLETQNVATDASGNYSVLLGSTTATGLPGDLFSQQEQRWLGVQVQGEAEQPRVLLVSVPYAMKAAEADKLAGHSASEFVTTDNLQSAVQQLQGRATTVSAGAPAGANSNSTAALLAPVTTNPATNFVDNTTDQVVLVQQNGTGVGLKASSPGNVGVLGTVSSKAKSGIVAGVEGTSSIESGIGVFGYSTATSGGIGAQGRSDSLHGIGLLGTAIGTGGIAVSATETSTSGSPTGVVAKVSAPNATGALITNVATGTVTGPLISATTRAGTQFTVGGNGNVSAAGSVSGNQLISTVATGTAPLQVASTTLVPNLNASLLGGNAASAFALANGSPNYIQNGTAVQPSANFNVSGTGSANSFNTATTYQIGGSSVLSIGSPADDNLFLGPLAGASNVAGQGYDNTFSGSGAGYNNTTASYNTFSGYEAGYNNTPGEPNTFSGAYAGFNNTTGGNNTFSGYWAGMSNTTGELNTFSGTYAGLFNTTGRENTFNGVSAGRFTTTGSYNTFSGDRCGPQQHHRQLQHLLRRRCGHEQHHRK